MQIITISCDIGRELHCNLHEFLILFMEMVHVFPLYHLDIQHSSITTFGSGFAVNTGNPVFLVSFMIIIGRFTDIKVLLRSKQYKNERIYMGGSCEHLHIH